MVFGVFAERQQRKFEKAKRELAAIRGRRVMDDWKPSEEMVETAVAKVRFVISDERMTSALVAVYPLMRAEIEKEVLEKAAWLVERLPENTPDTIATALRAMIKEPKP